MDRAWTFDEIGSGARIGKMEAVMMTPEPTPMIASKPWIPASPESAFRVMKSPTPAMKMAHATHSWGRYFLVAFTLMPPTMENAELRIA